MPVHDTHELFRIEGACWRPQAFGAYELGRLHRYYQVRDLPKLDASLPAGKAVRLRKLIDLVGPDHGTKYITVESEDGDYAVSLPMHETAKTAIVIYEIDGKPIPREEGGPVRFVIPFGGDHCADVKSMGRILISRELGRDTRPQDRRQHEAVHAPDAE